MPGREIRIDFEKRCGRVKPLHCINGGPRSGGYGLPFDFTDEFVRMGIPLVRTEGSAGEYGQNQFINIHNITCWDFYYILQRMGSFNLSNQICGLT